ncbi:MAG: ABC transporter ATP-binding protein [Bacilli bacterium]|nr:ABC transporter ATP-binding protein [Bacilli bacterium]
MNNEENNAPRRRHMGPPGRGIPEKAKDFKGSIKRLFKELKSFRLFIYISLILAALGSILSIMAPNRLSDLTDEISKGLVVNSSNLEKVTKKTMANMSEEKMAKMIPDILKMDIGNDNIQKIMISSDISNEDKTKFRNILSGMKDKDMTKIMVNLADLPDSVLKRILPDSEYEGVKVSSDDKIALLRAMANKDKKNIKLPDTINKIFFKEYSIDGVKISSDDQVKFLTIASKMNKKDSPKKLYGYIDKMPKSIRKVVEPKMDKKAINGIVMFLVMLYVCSALFTYVESIIMATVSNKFAYKLRNDISNKINKLPLKYFDNHAIGDVLSRVTNDVDMIAQSMNQSLATLVSSLTLFLGTLIMMFITNWIMALTAIIASFIGFIFMFIVLGKSQKYFTARQEELGNLNGHIEEVYSGLNVVKVYNGKKEADRIFDEYNEKVYVANRKSQFLSGLMMPMMGFIGNFGYVCVCIVGALLTMNDYISFGVIVAFITYVRLFTSPLSQIAQAMTSMQSTAAASERVFEFMDEEEMSNEKKCRVRLDNKTAKGKIVFDKVVFKYDGNDEPTIKNFSAKVKPGQKIAIVGPTGAGKTTMVNLLMKFYDIDSGDIKIDDISIKELSRENIHSLFTMVLQDTWLFNGTVRDNIIYNRDNVSEEKLDEVCRVVGLRHFIKTLPEGYDTQVADNDSVSAGQRQLLTIARGMIEDAPFLILDEATSNVDTRTEELVQKAMDKLMEGRTSFIIAHRLSTIKNADLILVMQDGNIVETGNHEELIKKNGFYAELYNSQFEL